MTLEDLQKKIKEVKSNSSMLRVRETLMTLIPILKDKIGLEDVYTKTEVDTSFDDVNLEIQGLQSNKADVSDIPDVSNLATKTELTDGLASKIGDAPSDGKQYARQDEAWSEVVSGGGGSGSLVKVDLEDGTVAYKLDSNDLVPTTSSIDLRAGNQATNLGQYAVSISAELPEGYDNTASGESSTVSGGIGNTAEGSNSTVSGGNGNRAEGEASTVSGGEMNTATNYSETVVGMCSDNTWPVQTTIVAGSPIFRVGIGTYNERKDGFIVTNEGNLKLPQPNTGIELKSPNGTTYKLTVSDAGELVIGPTYVM